MSEIICKYCNKIFKSYQSRSNHYNRYHANDTTKNNKNSEKLQKENKYKCENCPVTFTTIQELDNHIKTSCVPCISHNNVFTFKTETFGKNKYSKDKGGDIYIIQTEFNLKNYYKIGITTNLYHRMSDYRCGAVLEPRIHCYFPIKNIKESDKILKNKLLKFNVKREIYKCDDLVEIKKIIKLIQKDLNSEELEIIPEIKKCDICECKFCNKVYTNKYDLTIHLNNCEIKSKIKKCYICKYCNKKLARYDSLKRHELKCKSNNEKLEISLKEENQILKNFIKEQSEQLNQIKSLLSDLLNKNCKVHHKTLQKINKKLNVCDNSIINKNINNSTLKE